MDKWEKLKDFIEKENEHPLLSNHDASIYQKILDKMKGLENDTKKEENQQ